MTKIECYITPAHLAPSLKRQPPSELRLSGRGIFVAFICQALRISMFVHVQASYFLFQTTTEITY